MKDGAALTKRKAGDKLPPESGYASDEGGVGGGDVRAVEFDIRPLCAGEPARRYLQLGEQLSPVVRGQPLARSGSLGGVAACLTLSGLTRELKEMFLPAGYPDSVSEDYLSFQLWDTTQAMCSYLRGVLATQSVLQSVGVGDDKATPLAAALQWVLRDGSGMIGGLAFTYAVGPKFDLNVKRWRLFADVINDVGLTLDMVAPYFPSLVTEVLCVSSVCKTMCGVAAGATRSSLMTHFAKRDNMADCSAKEGSQETAVKLFGLLFGMYFANAVNTSKETIWVAFIVLTIIHVIANYNAVSGLCIPTINSPRGLILVQRFLKSSPSSTKDVAAEQGQFTIRSVNKDEPIVSEPALPIANIIMGSQLVEAVSSTSHLDSLLHLYSDETYLLTVDAGHRVHVVFQVEAKPVDELRAYFQAVLMLDALASLPKSPPLSSNNRSSGPVPHQQLLESTYNKMTSDFPLFFQLLQNNGWRTHMFLLNTSSWRIKLSDRS